jgi:plastocyanin
MGNNKIRIIITIIIIALILIGGYLFFWKEKGKEVMQSQSPVEQQITNQPEEIPTKERATEEGTGEEEIYVVSYTDSGYSPSTITIKKGETVTFKNESSRSMWPASAVHPSHRVYSGTSLEEHCPDTAGTAFDACKGYSPGQSWSFKFDKVGTWKYHDHLNPSATGTIIVEE